MDRLWTGWDPTPVPVRALNAEVPERLARLIERLLAADRAARPASAHEVELELASLDPHSQRGSGVFGAAAGGAAVVSPLPRRKRLVLAAVGLAAIGLAAMIPFAGGLLGFRAPTAASSGGERPPTPGAEAGALVSPAVAPPKPVVIDDQAVVPNGMMDEAWRQAVAAEPPQRQLNAVLQMLGRRNPKFDWLQGSGWVEQYGVIRITIDADTVSDLRPIEVLRDLTVVRCRGSAPGLGILTDLTPLAGLTLKELHCRNNPRLRDLSPIRPDGLEFLDASYTDLATLDSLGPAPLVTLKIAGTPVADLGPIRKLSKLRALDCTDCPIADFEPLTAIPLRELRANVRTDEEAALLRRIKTLETMNRVPVKEFWKAWPAGAAK